MGLPPQPFERMETCYLVDCSTTNSAPRNKIYTTIISTISMYIYLWSLVSAGRTSQRVEVASCFQYSFPETKKLIACEFHNQAQIVAIQWGNPQTRFDVMTDYNHPKSYHWMLFAIGSLNLTVRLSFWTAKLPQHHKCTGSSSDSDSRHINGTYSLHHFEQPFISPHSTPWTPTLQTDNKEK